MLSLVSRPGPSQHPSCAWDWHQTSCHIASAFPVLCMRRFHPAATAATSPCGRPDPRHCMAWAQRERSYSETGAPDPPGRDSRCRYTRGLRSTVTGPATSDFPNPHCCGAIAQQTLYYGAAPPSTAVRAAILQPRRFRLPVADAGALCPLDATACPSASWPPWARRSRDRRSQWSWSVAAHAHYVALDPSMWTSHMHSPPPACTARLAHSTVPSLKIMHCPRLMQSPKPMHSLELMHSRLQSVTGAPTHQEWPLLCRTWTCICSCRTVH